MTKFSTQPLSPSTWAAFDALVLKHNGVWGGCWCMAFHAKQSTDLDAEQPHRAQKKRLVDESRTHSAVVFDGDLAVGWCQFGSPDELPRIKSRKAYQAELDHLPDWRITCFFVDKAYRGKGVAIAALQGALKQIADLGGGIVESYPEDLKGARTSPGFVHNCTIGMFEREGFERVRKIGKHRWVVRRTISKSK